jgi:plasmid replication initiation protein
MVKEIYKRNWDFILYKVDDDYVLSVVFFGAVDYHRSFKVDSQIMTDDYEDLKSLSEDIRNNYEKYKPSEIIPAILNSDE